MKTRRWVCKNKRKTAKSIIGSAMIIVPIVALTGFCFYMVPAVGLFLVGVVVWLGVACLLLDG